MMMRHSPSLAARLRPALILFVLAALPACATLDGRSGQSITSQPSYGSDFPVDAPVPTVGLEAPDGPILNAEGGEVPRGVYTPPVNVSGLGDPDTPADPSS